jgi:hypothetical protein
MTDSYPPFSGADARCRKCHGSVGTRYYPAGTVLLASHPGGGQSIGVRPGAEEWLLRSCNDCDFAWPEACADAHVDTMFEPREDT